MFKGDNMITKKLYVDAVKAIEKFDKFTFDAHKLGIDIFEVPALSNLEAATERLLEYCTEDTPEPIYGTTDLGYYLYEGEKSEDRMWDSDGNVIPMTDVNDLWNYIAKERPHIVDLSTKE